MFLISAGRFWNVVKPVVLAGVVVPSKVLGSNSVCDCQCRPRSLDASIVYQFGICPL
jgi:hypothetical protein